jgi:hypothetical protein
MVSLFYAVVANPSWLELDSSFTFLKSNVSNFMTVPAVWPVFFL